LNFVPNALTLSPPPKPAASPHTNSAFSPLSIATIVPKRNVQYLPTFLYKKADKPSGFSNIIAISVRFFKRFFCLSAVMVYAIF
jgi:hypothetical protein